MLALLAHHLGEWHHGPVLLAIFATGVGVGLVAGLAIGWRLTIKTSKALLREWKPEERGAQSAERET